MPANLDFALYFNIAFFSALGLGMLFGFLKGLKKAMWGFFITLIFYAVFFLTLDQVVSAMWTTEVPNLGGMLSSISLELADANSLSDALPLALQAFVPEDFVNSMTNEHLIEFLSAFSMFVLKIVYMIVYFTVFQIIYRFVLWILRMFILPTNKKTDKYKSKNRGFGALFGLGSGILSLYVALIMFGGLVSIVESIVILIPEDANNSQTQVTLGRGFQDPLQPVHYNQFSFSDLTGDATIDEALVLMNDMVDSYNANIIVQAQNSITMTSEITSEEMPLNLYLFDEILSIDYQEEQIAFRQEIDVYANVASEVINSTFIETRNYSDITGDEIRSIFSQLGESNLFSSLIPIAVEIGADYSGVEIEVPTEELYAIDWGTEIMQLGEIAAIGFDIVNSAGIFTEDIDLNTVTIDGTEVEQLFVSLSESDLVTLAAYVAIEPVLEGLGDDMQGLITVPDDIVWADEFLAIGALANEILSSGLTIGDIESTNINAILSAVSEIDFTVLLNSKIITNAIINILSGETSIVLPDFIVIPDDIDWFGDELAVGELENILTAISSLASLGDSIDFNDLAGFDLQMLADLDLDAIDALFESRILIASITEYLRTMDLGEGFTIVIPDSVFDEDGYLLKSELLNIVDAAGMIVTELVCPVDQDCGELGVDINAALNLSSENIDLLLASDILYATVGTLITDMATGDETTESVLVIPGSVMSEILVDEVASQIISKAEIKNVFLAVTALGISDIDNIQVDATILQNLATENDTTVLDTEKADKLFGSVVLKATISKFLFDYANTDDPFVVVPYVSQTGVLIRETDSVDNTEWITEGELTNILEAILALDIEDFNNVETLDLNTILDNVSVLLDSSILHATVSKQLLDLGQDMVIPELHYNGDPLKIVVGDVGKETTYIDRYELEAAFDALGVLNITDIQNVSVDVSILNNLAVEGQPTVLDTTKSDKLFGSTIINATLSKYLIDFTDVAEGETQLVIVPYFDETGAEIRLVDDNDGTVYISETELTNILKAVLALDIQDFNTIDTLDLSSILSNISTILDSAIMQATVSKQLLDLTDVVVVPGSVKITQGVGIEQTEYISKLELEATFAALDVLEITDINNVSMDVTVINRLGTEADPTVLDTEKSDTLFGSKIINATISKYLLDFTEADDPFVIVPYYDQTGATIRDVDAVDLTTQTLSQTELTNILKAILAINITDFNNVETLNLTTILDNIDVLLDSAIMHATVSNQLLQLTDVVVVPTESINAGENDVRLVVGSGLEETTYIDRQELIYTFDALEVLNITDINNVSMSIDILNEVADDTDPTVLDTTKSDILLGSTIINATISKYIMDFTGGETAVIVVPYQTEDGVDLILIDSVDGTEIVEKQELENILAAILALDITDFNTVDALSMQTIIDNKGVLLDSSILQATISKQMIDMGTDVINIPYYTENYDEVLNPDELVRITVGPVGKEVEFIAKSELNAMLDALNTLGLNNLEDFQGSIDFGSILSDPLKIDALVASSILQATISDQVLSLTDETSGDSLMEVPYLAEDGVTQIRKTVGGVGFETEYITVDEIRAIFNSLNVLGIGDISQFTGTIDLSLLADDNNVNTLLSSSVVQATISKQLIDLDDGVTIIIPFEKQDDITPIRLSVGPVGQETEYIVSDELRAIFDALDVLGIEDVNDFSGNDQLSLTTITEGGNLDIILQSSMLQAIISKQIIDLDDSSGLIEVPFFKEDNLSAIRITVTSGLNSNDYVDADELNALILSLNILGLGNVDEFSGTVNLSLLADPLNKATVLSSSVIQATISSQLIDTADGSTFIIPKFEQDTVTPVVLVTGPLGFETTYISNQEISDLLDALDVLGLTDVTDFSSSSVDFQTFAQGNNAVTMTNSVIIQAIISKQLIDLDTSNTINVPYLADDDLTALRITVTSITNQAELVEQNEIVNTIKALAMLNVGDPSAYTGAVDISLFYDEASRNTLLASSIMQATISKQVLDLGSSIIIVPTFAADSTTEVLKTVGTPGSQTDYILKPEIHALFEALEILGVDDITSFTGTVGLTKLFASSDVAYDSNQDIMLGSAIMHATFSKQISDMGSTTITIPTTDDLGTDILVTVATVDFITKLEIKSLLNAMDILGFTGNLDGFGGAISLNNLDTDLKQTTLLASAIMHATITDQVTDLGGTGAFIVPTHNALGASITVTPDTFTFITKVEIKSLLNAMNVLGIGGDMSSFGGTIGLSSMFASQDIDYDTNQDTVLSSAIMHATVTDQVKSLGTGGSIVIPDEDFTGTSIINTVSGTDYFTTSEIKSLLNAMDVIGFGGNLDGFSGTIGLSTLLPSQDVDYDTNQNTMLASAIMHATMTDQIDNIAGIKHPDTDYLGNSIRVVQASYTFLAKAEIKSLINALDIVGFGGDLGSFGGTIGLADLSNPTNQTTLLASATMHATLSDKLLNDTGGALYIPDVDINTATTIRLTHSGTFFIELNETKALLTALNAMGLTNYAGMSVSPSAIFSADFDTVLTSATMQATISANILGGALDDTAASGSGSLIIPNYFREDITIATVGQKWIEKVELRALLDSLNTLGINDFSGSVSGSIVTGMNDTQLNTLLGSGSMQVTIDNMLDGNPALSIPDLAEEDVYNMTNITTKAELINFIKATQQLGAGDITNVTFSVAIVQTLDANQRDIAFDSMIVRNMLTTELEALMLADDPFDLYWPANSSYMNSDPATFLTEAGINEVLNHYGLI
jgi:hypothetical protein